MNALGTMSPRDAQALFPIKTNRTYLNNASISPLSLRVIAAVDGFMAEQRDTGRNNYPQWCRKADGEIKERIARLIGAESSEIAFRTVPESMIDMSSTRAAKSCRPVQASMLNSS